MKIALCIFGYPVPKNSLSYSNLRERIIDKFSPDIYIHAWLSQETHNNLSREQFIKLYSPTRFLIEEPATEDKNDLSYLTSKMKVNMLRKKYQTKENITYDWIITLRYDTLLVSYQLDFLDIEKGNIYVLEELVNKEEFLNIFTLSDSYCSEIIYSLYDEIDKPYFKALVSDICKEFWIEYIKKLNIPIIKISLLSCNPESS